MRTQPFLLLILVSAFLFVACDDEKTTSDTEVVEIGDASDGSEISIGDFGDQADSTAPDTSQPSKMANALALSMQVQAKLCECPADQGYESEAQCREVMANEAQMACFLAAYESDPEWSDAFADCVMGPTFDMRLCLDEQQVCGQENQCEEIAQQAYDLCPTLPDEVMNRAIECAFLDDAP